MTAPTRSSTTLFDALVAAAITKAGAIAATGAVNGNGGWIDISAYNGGDIGYSITNGSSAPTAPLWMTIQFANTTGVAKQAYDRFNVGGDSVPSGVPISGLVPIPKSAKFVRVLGYGNTTNGVNLFAVALLTA